MKVTRKLIEWMVENDHWGDVPEVVTSAMEFNLKNKVGMLLANGALPPDKYSELSGGREMNSPSPEKMFARGGHVRVKDPSESYSSKRYTAKHSKTGEQVTNPFTREPCATPSELDNARAGVLFKHLAMKAGIVQGMILPEHEKALLADVCEHEAWCGTINGEEHDRLPGGGHVKQLIDDAVSGGINIVPMPFDENIVSFPLLTSELLPRIDLVPIDKGRRVMGGSLATPTMSWGQGDNIQVPLFATGGMSAAINTTIFGCSLAVEVGRDFLQDSGVNVGAALTRIVGERMQAELDRVIAVGNGGTEPTGIFTTAGIPAVLAVNGAAGPPTFADYLAVHFAIGKQYRSPSLNPCFLSNDVSYQRSRAIAVDPLGPAGVNQLPVLAPLTANEGFQNYVTMGFPHLVQNTVTNPSCAFGAFKTYRLYRRVGMSIEWVQGGTTLARRNMAMLVLRGRYGGQVTDVNAWAAWTNGQA